MSRPERFDLKTAAPLPAPLCAAADRTPPPPCETCAEELRCPFRALARWLAT